MWECSGVGVWSVLTVEAGVHLRRRCLVFGVDGAEQYKPYHGGTWTWVGRGVIVCARHQVGDIGKRHWGSTVVCTRLHVEVIHLEEEHSR